MSIKISIHIRYLVDRYTGAVLCLSLSQSFDNRATKWQAIME
jgi:hypothetical protein